MKFRRLLRIIHRDLGYFIVGMTIVYALSGIFLNHRHDFNPDYIITVEEFNFNPVGEGKLSASDVRRILEGHDKELVYKKHYTTKRGEVKVFIENGEVVLNPESGQAWVRYLQRRPILFEMNRLHKASIGTVWKWVSDVMAATLLLVAISGLFLLKGKHSFTRWGWWLTLAGILVPLTFALLFV